MNYGDRPSDEELRDRHLEDSRANDPSVLAQRFDMPVFGLAGGRIPRTTDPSWSDDQGGVLKAASVSVRYGEDPSDSVVVQTHRNFTDVPWTTSVLEERLIDALANFYLQQHPLEMYDDSARLRLPLSVLSGKDSITVTIDGHAFPGVHGTWSDSHSAVVSLSHSILVNVTWGTGEPPGLTALAGIRAP